MQAAINSNEDVDEVVPIGDDLQLQEVVSNDNDDLQPADIGDNLRPGSDASPIRGSASQHGPDGHT